MANPAETYEREMVPALFAPWVPVLLDLVAPRAGERLIDLACGSGAVARRAAARVGAGGRVVGLDLNPAMLDVARAVSRREGLAIEWTEGRMEAVPFGEGEFDVATCHHGLQFVPEPERAVAEMRRVLREDGRLAIAVWQGLDRHSLFSAFNDALVRHIGVPALAAPFAMEAVRLRTLLAGAGFREIVTEPRSMPAVFTDPAGFVAMEVDVIAAAIPATQHLDEAARADLAAAISGDLEGPVRRASADGRLVVPMHAYLARAVR